MPPPPSTVRPASVRNLGRSGAESDGGFAPPSLSSSDAEARGRLMLRPLGVYHSAVVSFTAPSSTRNTRWALPLPFRVSPTERGGVVARGPPRHDLARRRGPAVGEHDERHVAELLRRL